MPVTIDGTNQIITLPAGTAGVLQVDVERDLYSAWKTWFKTPGNAKYQLAFRGSVGGDVLAGVLEAGSYFFLQNQLGWRIKPFEENGDIVFSGNLIAEDDTLPILKKTTGAFNVLVSGLQPITQNISAEDVEHSSFDGGVTIDVINGSTLAAGASGNSREPLNNFSDAKAVAGIRGLGSFFVEGAFTFGATDDLSNMTVIGKSTVTTNIFTITAGAITTDTRFEECTVQGTLKGKIEAVGVIFGAITDMDYSSWLLDVWFDSDVSLKGGGAFIVINGGSTIAPGSTQRPNFDYTNVTTAKSNFIDWRGNIGFKNVTTGNISIGVGSGGKVFIDASDTGGSIFVTPGDVVIEGQSGGMSVLAPAKALTLPQFVGLK